ncbi:hypothetical protein F4782DRAFT_525847 [Xylaria castorea]|nr:hypothetical protein F4782DRAFT_525847 [Xylaria castorea]
MIEESFKNLDALVYDTPNPPLGLRKKEHVDSGNPYYMSGALTDPSPTQFKGGLSVARSAGDTKTDPMNCREPMQRSNLFPTPVENGAQPSSPQVRPSSSRRETPIPAPQPWTGLGIQNPFADHLSHNPTNRGQPRCFETASAPQMEERALSQSKPQVFSGPDSSPLNGFPRSRTNRNRNHKQKHEK